MGGEPERDGEEQRRPLLSSSSSSSPALAVAEQEQHQFLDRSSSSVQLHGGGLGCGGPEVSADEVRSATSFSSAQAPAPHGGHADPYPPSIHSAELSPPPSHAPSSPYPNGMCWMRWRSDSCSLIMLDIDAVGEVILPGNGKLPPSRTSLSMLDLLKPSSRKET